MELQVLEDVLRRMDRQVLRDVSLRIRHKIVWTEGEGESDADFLKAYYAALRDRLEKTACCSATAARTSTTAAGLK